MKGKFTDLKRLYKLETLSNKNFLARYFEEFERFPMELDDAELDKLGSELEALDNPLSGEAASAVDLASQRLRPTLERQHAKQKELLAEKSFLMAESAKQSAIAKSVVKKVENTKLNMKDRYALEELKYGAKSTIRRMEYNKRLLSEWDTHPRTIARRRNHLRKLMCRDAETAERYESALGNRMMIAKRSYTHTRDYDDDEKLNDGSASLHHRDIPFMGQSDIDPVLHIVGIHTDNIATPIDEVDFIGDGGFLAGYMSLVAHLPEIIPMIRRGMSVDEILSDGALKEKARELVTREFPVVVSRIGEERYPNEERYQAIDLETQRRVVIARLFGIGVVPAKLEAIIR